MAYLNETAGAARESNATAVTGSGPELFVDTVAGNNGSGLLWSGAYTTMGAAFANLLARHTATAKSADNATIYVRGVIAEQISAPLGVSGVRVIGASGGRPRHDNGVRWKEAAVAGAAPLCIVHEQGWEFHDILFVPQATYSAIKLWRAEDAVHPDGSHAIFKGCKFIGAAQAGIGIEDYGGMHHVLVEDCEFNDLASGIIATNVSIAAPLRNVIQNNIFEGNKNDIAFNGSKNIVRGNLFRDVYHATTHPITVNLAYTADPATGNSVVDNLFADISANVTIAKGYKPSTGDNWLNHVAGTAAYIAAVPS